MKHSVSKNNEVNEDEDSCAIKSLLFKNYENNRKLTQMCGPFQRNNLSISPQIDIARKKSLFSRVASQSKNHREVVFNSEADS
jgi:hypothetical protein